MDAKPQVNQNPYQRKFLHHEPFLAHYLECYCDFVYVLLEDTFYTDFYGGNAHVEFLAEKYKQAGGKTTGSIWGDADAFVTEGHGMFKSRAGSNVMCSKSFHLPHSLQPLRRDLEYM